MGWLLSTFGFCLLSALIPVLNAEVFLAALAASEAPPLWPMAIVAAAGQMLGKIVYYYLGKSSLEWSWVKKRTDTPRFQATLEKWRLRLENRPWVAAAFVFASAAIGIPPFAIVAVLAGTLRTSLSMFIVVGFVGRALRFASILGAAAWFFA
jgi:membrane protein YqaA with SNARE-associated domain